MKCYQKTGISNKPYDSHSSISSKLEIFYLVINKI